MSEASESVQYRAHILERRTSFNYVSDWLTVMKAPHFDTIGFEEHPENGDVDVVVSVTAVSAEDRFIAFEYLEGWQFHSKFIPVLDYDTERYGYIKRKIIPPYWCYTTDHSKEIQIEEALGDAAPRIVRKRILSIANLSEKREKEYVIKVVASSVSRESYLYLMKLNEQSDFVGVLFTPTPDRLVGNVSCEEEPEQIVLGYIYATTVSAFVATLPDRFILDRSFATEDVLNYFDSRIYFETNDLDEKSFFSTIDWQHGVELSAQYDRQFSPYDSGHIYEIDENGQITTVKGILWMPNDCFDCALAKGTQAPPSNWPR